MACEQPKIEKSEGPQNTENEDKNKEDDNRSINPSIDDWNNGGSHSIDLTEKQE